MTETTRARMEAQRIEDLRRLAGQAERKGVCILVDHKTGTHVATSASDPTRCYVVTVDGGCTCLGAIHGGKCQHHALLLSELGLLGDVEAEDEEPAPVCRECQGSGYVRIYYGGHLSDWVADTCNACKRAEAAA